MAALLVAGACAKETPAVVDASVSEACPLRLSVSSAATGWSVAQGDSSARLVGITFYDGAPKHEASLVPDSTTRVGDADVAVWVLPKASERKNWLSCRYERTTAVVSRPLASSMHSAEVTYDAKASIEGLPVVLKLVLKP